MAETKQCPDCAERVLAAARKCRYCGYRFDGRGGLLANLLPGFRKERRDVPLETILADWDVRLDNGEEAELFRLAELDGRFGYLLVTGTRLVFLADLGKSRHDKLVEHPLAGVSYARIRGSFSRREIEFGGASWEHAVRLYDGGEQQRLVGLLTAHLAEPTSTD